MSNADRIRAIYEAFGRGDVPAILERLSPVIEWEYDAGPADTPWLQARRGRDGAAAFFALLPGIEFHRFEVKQVLEGEGVVVGLVDVEATVKATGGRIDEADETHIFWFDDAGLVTRFRHRVDTLRHHQAFHAKEAAPL